MITFSKDGLKQIYFIAETNPVLMIPVYDAEDKFLADSVVELIKEKAFTTDDEIINWCIDHNMVFQLMGVPAS